MLASGPRSGLPPRQPTPSVPNLNASRRVQTTKNRKQRAGCAPRRTRSAKERRPSSSEPSPNVPGNHRVRPSRPRTSHRPVDSAPPGCPQGVDIQGMLDRESFGSRVRERCPPELPPLPCQRKSCSRLLWTPRCSRIGMAFAVRPAPLRPLRTSEPNSEGSFRRQRRRHQQPRGTAGRNSLADRPFAGTVPGARAAFRGAPELPFVRPEVQAVHSLNCRSADKTAAATRREKFRRFIEGASVDRTRVAP